MKQRGRWQISTAHHRLKERELSVARLTHYGPLLLLTAGQSMHPVLSGMQGQVRPPPMFSSKLYSDTGTPSCGCLAP